MADAWVRPRIAGYIPFQSHASAMLRAAIVGKGPIDAALERIDVLFDSLATTSASTAAERSRA